MALNPLIYPKMADFKPEDILAILQNYFELSLSDELTKLCERLSGPPNLVYFFLKAASQLELSSQEDLVEKWSMIETSAIALFASRIPSAFKGDLDKVARNLSLLHLSAIMLKQDFIEITEISRHLVKLVEAGLLRVHKHGGEWKIFIPNRFLIHIFSRYVRWYTWDRLDMLQSLLKASSATTTQNGKLFEYLFALELCTVPNCKLWTFLSVNSGLHNRFQTGILQ